MAAQVFQATLQGMPTYPHKKIVSLPTYIKCAYIKTGWSLINVYTNLMLSKHNYLMDVL